MLSELLALVAAGDLDPALSRTVPLQNVPSVLTELGQRQVRGKIVQSG
jgi:D-arabinose 1-dehydrogenase-like Zn-dependent alcohol dehydrogenase